MTSIRSLALPFVFSLSATFAGAARADALVTTLGPTSQPHILNVEFSGTASVDYEYNIGFAGFGWGFAPNSFDPFPAAITGSNYGLQTILSSNATLVNTTTGKSYAIIGAWLQDSSNSGGSGFERFGAYAIEPFFFRTGEVLKWSGTLQIDLSPRGLTFADLAPGTSGEVYDFMMPYVLGRLVVSGIPEAPASILSGCGLLLIVLFRTHAGRTGLVFLGGRRIAA